MGRRPYDPLVLLDPVTGDKLVCGEQVEAWQRALARGLPESDKDEDLAAMVFAPIVQTAVVIGIPWVALTAGPYFAARSTPWRKLHRQAREALQRGRPFRARDLLERALLKGGDQARRRSTLLLDLARALLATGDARRARVALEQFVHQGLIADERAYRTAEDLARELGSAPPRPCRHRGAIRLAWTN
jgi:hypothetical protein